MISKLVKSFVVAVVVTLGCILLGEVFNLVNIAIIEILAGFLKAYGVAIGVLSGVWYFFTH